MRKWKTVALGDVMQTCIDAVPTVLLQSVNLAGVYGFGRGLFKRGLTNVAETSYKKFHRLHSGDFVISSPKAWEGALSFISDEFDGWFLSPVFPTFRADAHHLDTRYLDWYCKRSTVWRQLQHKAKGIGARRETVSPEHFLSLHIPLPPLHEQQAIVARLDTLAEKTRQVQEHLNAAERAAERLLALRFREAIADAPLRPMGEVAPLIRREVKIDLGTSYPELGIRSFGKGTFHKPALSGSDVGTKRLYCIEPGDLLFSNVFAWEGAIAIARPEDAGRFGSHRFMTCCSDPEQTCAEFLRYYFLSTEGLLKISNASPGGAGRNRTLGQEKLMSIQVPAPPLPVQQSFTRLQTAVTALKARHAAIAAANEALLPAVLQQLF